MRGGWGFCVRLWWDWGKLGGGWGLLSEGLLMSDCYRRNLNGFGWVNSL